MQLGTVAETIMVTGDAPLLQTDSSTVSSLINEKTVQDAPIPGRNIIRMVQLIPGARTKGVGGHWLAPELASAKSPPAAMPFTVSGPVPELLRTACLTALVVPTFSWPKSIRDGVSVAPGVGIGRTMVQAPRPWVQATRFWSSWVSVIWSTRTVGMPVPSGTQLSVNGADPPQKVQIMAPRSVPM